MNFQALEGLIQSIVSQYNCESCKEKVTKQDLDIQNLEGTAVTLKVNCSHCSHVSFIKSEVVTLDLTKYLSEEQLELVKSTMKEGTVSSKTISDEEITDMHKFLNSNNCSVGDFLD